MNFGQPNQLMVPYWAKVLKKYASSIIQAARNHPVGIGAVSERDVLIGMLPFSGFERLSQEQERIVLEATADSSYRMISVSVRWVFWCSPVR